MNFSFRKQQQRWIWPSRSAGSRVWSKSTDNQYDDDHEHEDFAPEEPERDNGWTANPKIRAIGIESYNSAFSTGISPFSIFWGFHLFQCFGDFTFSTVWKQYNFFLYSSGNLKGSTSARRTQVILNFYIWYKRVKVRKLFRKWKAKGESGSGIIWALKVKVKQDFGESEKILVLTNGDGSFVNEIRIEKLSKV